MNPSPRRMLAALAASLVCCLLGTAAQAQVVINEIHYNPPGDDGTVLLEFVELHNTSAAAVDVTGWRLVFGADPYVFPGGTSVPAGGRVVVAENASNLQAATGFLTTLQWAGLNTGLSNSGETVDLLDGSLVLRDKVIYADAGAWPTAPDGNGPSLELTNPALNNDFATSWSASVGSNGTPGAQNSTFSAAPTISLTVPARQSAVSSLSSVQVTFSSPVTGVTAGSLTVNGSPATLLSGAGAGPYTFTGFAPPPVGSASIAVAAGSIQAGAVPFGGDSWTVSTGIAVVFNELHYHPPDAVADAEFVELHNPGAAAVDMSGWTIADGLVASFGPATSLAPGGYLVVALNPALLQSTTGYAGALAWTSGRLNNSGERLALLDASGNQIDEVTFADSGDWPTPPDGDGPTLELINPGLPNQFGSAWQPSLGANGTPGAINSVFDPAPTPIITAVQHLPLIPLGNQSVTVTALILDDVAVTAATLYHRQDQDPTVAYTATPMVDDGAHGDGAAGDNLYGAIVSGLPDGQRLDFTIRADDGSGTSAAPAGHDTLAPGAYPAQTYLAKFSNTPPATDFPSYHLVTTQHVRNLQEAHNEDEHDGTFLRCGPGGCENFYNVVERYRGQSSLNQHPHSFRINLPSSDPLASEMGFDITRVNLHAQTVDKQELGYEFFRNAFGGAVPASHTQFVRLHTSPLSHGGTQDWIYVNVERVDDDFLESQSGDIVPTRFPDRCSISATPCDADTDCPGGETCVPTDNGNLYRGRLNGDLQYLGTDENSYRNSYDKETNADEDIWTDLIDQCFVADPDTTPDASYESAFTAFADEEEWARYFAVNMLLVNQEGGIYRDTGDDYFIYFQADGSPFGRDSKLLPVDMDSVYGGFGATFAQETIWRTTVQTAQRFLRSNAFAGRFVGAICHLMDNDFQVPIQNARIDALPNAVANAARKQALKDWVVARRAFVTAEIKRDLTLTGVPASPYTAVNPVISVSGQLNQCGTRSVLVNGQPATFNVFSATWSANVTLSPGPNTIVVQNLDPLGNEIEREEASVTYAPPGVDLLRLTLPRRMVAGKTQTVRAEIVDGLGRIQTQGCPQWGSVSVRRLSDSSNVPITVTVFDGHLSVPDNGIRFYNGMGSVSFTLDAGAAFGSGDVEVSVTVDGVTASKVVSVEGTPTFRSLSGTLSGAGLTWGPDENIRLTGNATVPSGSTLSILPGTLVMVDTTGSLDNGTLLQVNGSVSASGSADRPIHFFSERGPLAMTLTQSGSASNANSWQGIHHDGSGTSTYTYVFLTGAGNGQVISHPRPPIVRFNSTHSTVVDHCTFVDNDGMALAGPGTGSYTIRNTLISRCGIGAEFNGNGHTLLVEDTWWTSCGWAPEPNDLDGDLVHIDGSASNQTIRRNVIADGGDDGIDHSNSTYTVENTLIYGILDKAVSMTAGFGNFENVLIYGSGTGIRGAASCTHCTINVGSPILSPSSVQNSILWPSSVGACSSNIDYTIGGDSAHVGCGTGNLSVNPQFENAGQCDFDPAPGSPALTAGPTGGRIGWLGFPEAFGCDVAADCDDSNVCTLDSCGAGGVCVFEAIAGCEPCTGPADCSDGDPCTLDVCSVQGTCQNPVGNEGGACSDGVACTVDACASGSCVGTPSCPVGQTCNLGSGICETVVTPQTVTFRQDVAGYTGTQDTWLAEGSPTTPNGAVADWRWDTDDPASSGSDAYGAIRFDGIFGNGAGQIPPGSTIQSATLGLTVFNNSVAPAGQVRDALVDWSEATATWNNFGGEAGVQADEYGAAIVAAAPLPLGAASIDVTASLAAWSSGGSNFGWVFVPQNTDGLQVRSSEYGTVAERPVLTVTYVPSAGCVDDPDCDDGDPCNGAETCAAGVCQFGTPPTCNDFNTCTSDTCVVGVGCQSTPVANGTPCLDGTVCNGAESCQAGTCSAGTPLVCNDGIACTTDSCDDTGGCQAAPNCPVGQTCNLGTGLCQAGAQTFVYQEGAGYAGTQDTWLAGASPTTVNGAAVTWRWDTENPAPSQDWGLLRFDGIFGGGPGQIPPGSTIQSASLTLVVSDVSAAPAGDVVPVLVDWSEATATWNNFGGEAGVQGDEIGATVTAAPINLGPAVLDVTASLQAWSTSPATNFGWAVRPNSNNGAVVASAENATAADRPKLTVTFVPGGPVCSTNPECDDGLFCNGAETCNAGSCQAGAPPNCDDGLACSTDACDEGTDACTHTSCAMSASAVGPRYLSVSPPAGMASVALRVSSASLPCLPRYVNAAGRLGDAPVFQSSAAWGTVQVADEEIVPATAYTVQAESSPGVAVGSASATTWAWGDATNGSGVNLFDILCVLDGTVGVFTDCALQAVDLAPAVPDGVIDAADAAAATSAFSGSAYPDLDACDGSGGFAAGAIERTAGPVLHLLPRTSTLQAGEIVSVDVFVAGIPELSSYSVSLTATGDSGRPLTPEAVHIDHQRGDYVFHGATSYPALDVVARRLGSALPAGAADATGARYLGTFLFRAGPGTTGRSGLTVDVATTALRGPGGRPLAVKLPGALRIEVASSWGTGIEPRVSD